MQVPPDKYVVRKGKEWLMSSRPDLLELPHKHVFSQYVNDAKRFETRKEARRKAKMIGGTVWTFNPVTGKHAESVIQIPAGAKCDNCYGYRPITGLCLNGDSEYYGVPVSMDDICEDWEGQHERTGKAESGSCAGRGTMEAAGD